MKYDTIVVGGGIAGLTAAAYLAKAGRSVALFEKQEKTGGLIQSFWRNGILFDGGLRSIENSGIVFPMLRQLGIEIEFEKSHVGIGIADRVLKLENEDSLWEYEALLMNEFPDNKEDVRLIVKEVRKIMDYMDVLYGLDNPAFMDLSKNRKYVFQILLPWMVKFLFTIRKIARLDEPYKEFLQRFTQNQALIDTIGQHFFQETPASFALSYFSLYLDYYYPKGGGTAIMPQKLTEYIKEHQGEIKLSTVVEQLHPEEKYVIDSHGERTEYNHLIWAGDVKYLYRSIPVEQLKNKNLQQKIEQKKASLKPLNGGDSIFAIYLTLEEQREYFEAICTGHFFYTPAKEGLSTIGKGEIDRFVAGEPFSTSKTEFKTTLQKYLHEFVQKNTFEVSIPSLHDPALAPPGKVGMVISLLFDYRLSRRIEEAGWTREMNTHLEECIVEVFDQSLFPGLKSKVRECFSSSPLTIAKRTLSTEGAITGWAFTNPHMPAENRVLWVSKAVDTPLPAVYQAGQWTYSPAGMPISILTGKLAADKVLKRKKG
jgi:phytoene dehydrogenase-like protein